MLRLQVLTVKQLVSLWLSHFLLTWTTGDGTVSSLSKYNDQVCVYESRKQKFQSKHFYSASFILINQLFFLNCYSGDGKLLFSCNNKCIRRSSACDFFGVLSHFPVYGRYLYILSLEFVCVLRCSAFFVNDLYQLADIIRWLWPFIDILALTYWMLLNMKALLITATTEWEVGSHISSEWFETPLFSGHCYDSGDSETAAATKTMAGSSSGFHFLERLWEIKTFSYASACCEAVEW